MIITGGVPQVNETQKLQLSECSDDLLMSVVSDIMNEVIHSTHRQPSIPGVVCEVITEIIRADMPNTAAVEAVAVDHDKKKHGTVRYKTKVFCLCVFLEWCSVVHW